MKKKNLVTMKKTGRRVFAGAMAGGLLVGTIMPAYATEVVGEAATVENEKVYAKATDGSGATVEVSAAVLAQMAGGSVYLDAASGFLKDAATGQKVDPITGNRIVEQEPKPEEPNPEVPDITAPEEPKPENPDTPIPNPEEAPPVQEEPAPTPPEEQASPEALEDATNEEKSTNAELIARQTIVKPPRIVEDFRFWTVPKQYGFANKEILIRESIPEGEIESNIDDPNSRGVGILKEHGALYILQDEGNGWLYVESRNVRGFVKASDLLQGDEAQQVLRDYQKTAREYAMDMRSKYDGIDQVARMADILVEPSENKAFTYFRATTKETIAQKQFALCNVETLEIRETPDAEGRSIGSLAKDGLCYILADAQLDWVFVESGNVRGFVERTAILFDEDEKTDVKKIVEDKGEPNIALATENISSKENKSLYYSVASIKPCNPGDEIRASILEYASQFIGNPYVWGGTDLVLGADCSGFVQGIYRAYGYSLPRVSRDQANYGMKIPVDDAAPGDLIFYARDGIVYHVVMYIGEGRTIEAMNQFQGIRNGTVNRNDAVWATRILK